MARGRVGWDAYPISLRLQNWCGYFFGLHRERTEGDPDCAAALWRSVWLQAEWLRAHLEWHLLGNHLLENAVALAYAGSCFRGPDADAWRREGLRLLRGELSEQVLPDGGHFERSPMYQARAAHALGALLDVGDDELRALVEEPLERMTAVARLSHPDGGIALLNDSALGAQPESAALQAWLARAGLREALPSAPPGVFALPDTGYFGTREAAGHYLVCDAVPIGPDHLPPRAIVARLNTEIVKVVGVPELRKRMIAQGAQLQGSTPAELAAIVKNDVAKWSKVIRDAGVKLEP